MTSQRKWTQVAEVEDLRPLASPFGEDFTVYEYALRVANNCVSWARKTKSTVLASLSVSVYGTVNFLGPVQMTCFTDALHMLTTAAKKNF